MGGGAVMAVGSGRWRWSGCDGGEGGASVGGGVVVVVGRGGGRVE